MKKPIMKALAAGLAVTLALSSPVTAFAGSVADIFSTEEGGASKTDTSTSTGTSSHTNTKSGVVEIDETTEYKVIGVAFDKEVITPMVGEEAVELSAVILIDNAATDGTDSTDSIRVQELANYDDLMLTFEGKEVTAKDLYKNLSFYEDAVVSAENGVAEYDADGEFVTHTQLSLPKDKDGNVVGDTIKVTGTRAGNTYISVRLGETYKASALACVKDYNAKFEFDEKAVPEDCLYKKHTIDMNAALINDGNLDVTWRAYTLDSKNRQKNYKTIKADGNITFSKEGKVYVEAVAENGMSDVIELTVEKGTPATKVKFDTSTNEVNVKKPVITAGNSVEVKIAGIYEPAVTTDHVNFSVDKKSVGAVEFKDVVVKDGKFTATAVISKTGSVKITAAATSGKKATLSLKVTAPLQKITGIDGVKDIYPGQSVQLKAVTEPAVTDTKLTWKVYDSADATVTKASKYATIKNGKLTAKANSVDGAEVYVQASGKVKENGQTVTKSSDRVLVKILPSTVTGKKNHIISSASAGIKNTDTSKKITLYAGKSVDLDAVLEGVTDTNVAQAISVWTTNKAKVASVDNNGVVKAFTAGTATIKVSAVGKKASGSATTYTDTIKVTVKVPVRSIVLKKSDVTVNTKTKAQNVTLQVSQYLPKKCNKENIYWTIKDSTVDGVAFKVNSKTTSETWGTDDSTVKYTSKYSKATLVIPATAKLGDVITVEATAASGAKTTATITVCNKTTKVGYALKNADGKDIKKETLVVGADYIDVADYFTVISNGDKQFNEEIVSYTVNKKGIINLNGTTAYALKAGTVKVTAKTASGKSASITITVKNA